MWLVLFACAPVTDDPPAVAGWVIEPAVIDSPRVATSSFSPDQGELLGAMFGQFLPAFAEGNPAWDVPSSILAIGMDELVADAGSCPFEVREGDSSTFRSDCRSRDGYVWVGSFEQREWEEGEVARRAFSFDLHVTADVEDPRFTELAIDGSVVLGTMESVSHVDVDLAASLTGYFEARGEQDDPRVAAWADWRASGSVEYTDTLVRVQAAADIGGSGGVPMAGELDVDSSCPIEPSGVLDLGGDVVASFGGCDACADVVGGGEMLSRACVP